MLGNSVYLKCPLLASPIWNYFWGKEKRGGPMSLPGMCVEVQFRTQLPLACCGGAQRLLCRVGITPLLSSSTGGSCRPPGPTLPLGSGLGSDSPADTPCHQPQREGAGAMSPHCPWQVFSSGLPTSSALTWGEQVPVLSSGCAWPDCPPSPPCLGTRAFPSAFAAGCRVWAASVLFVPASWTLSVCLGQGELAVLGLCGCVFCWCFWVVVLQHLLCRGWKADLGVCFFIP